MKKRMSAFRKVISLFVLSCLFCGVLFAGVSCKTQELSIVLVDEFDRELLYVSEEYDALSLVVPQEKVTYSIAELFWFDVNLEKHDIPFSGTKFVQDLPYAVLMTLRAVKGKATAAADVELTVSFRTGDIVDAMLVSWVDDGVSLSLSAAHLFGGSKAGIRVSYNGSKNDVGNGRTFGGFGAQKARKAYSVTDWSDAVVTFYAYNPNVFDLTVALMWNDGVNGWRGAGQSGDVPSCVLKAGEWTTVAWSFLNLGVDFDFLNAGGNFVFKVWMDEAAAAGAANYQYSFYVCGMDIANYDATRFPDTDNTPPVTEFYTAPAAAALLASHKDDGITRAASEDPAYIRDYKKFGSNERSVAVTYNGNDNIPDDGFNFGGFASAYEHFSVGDWSGGSVVFGAYNPNLFDLNIGMAYDDGAGWKGTGYDQTVGATALPALEWTTVTYSFADLNVTGNFVENGGDFLFKVWLSAGVASTLSKPYAYTFYIREMDVVNNGPVPSTPALDAWANSWSDDGVSKTVTNNPKYLYGDEEAALKFGYRGELNSPGNGLNIGGFENASEYFSVTDWGDAAIRFYAYNSNVFDLTAALMWNDGSGWYGAGQTSLVPIRVLKAGEWTEVTWPLKSLGIETNFLENGGHFCVKMWIPENLAGAMAKPYSYEFYICGADIIDYTGSDPDPEIDSAAEIADVMLNSYADEDVSKTLTADSQYLYDGCEVGVKVRYTGNDGL
ncbi:MAG: hypothetical protein LBL66_03005, partial [Clostridiales bacterium]|nr:hypothetical protein [Clostridiales bacterium]